MPELPEVEATRRHIAPVVTGCVIEQFEVGRPRMARRQPNPADLPARLEGRRVSGIRRHGKFLLADIEGDFTWVTHLGMSGRLQVAAAGEARRPHTNVVVTVGEREIRFVDPRTFGFVAAYTPEEMAASPLALLGPDALEGLPPAGWLAGRMAGRAVPVKPLLLDQRFLAGIGNIYADEILYRAGIDPIRPAGSLGHAEVGSLHAAIRPVLEDGLAHGGTSLDDLAYLLPDGRAGEYLDLLAVYGRAGRRCRRCGGTIERRVVRGRSAFSCPGCQR